VAKIPRPADGSHATGVGGWTTVTDKRETSDGERGVVTMHVKAFNQDDELVCEFDRTALSLKRPEE
jgi:acyl dehydratase